MKIIKKMFSVCAAAILFIFFSCASTDKPAEFLLLPDYTNEDVRKTEIARIEEIQKTDSVYALWRAILLDDEKTVESSAEIVKTEYKAAIEKSDWFTAFRLYKSLFAVGIDVSDLEKNAVELEKLYIDLVPGLKNEKSDSDLTGEKSGVSQYINGTVTIWVDKGIKVENGVGYADRVIGSGFFISKDGYIVTNHHVISDLVNPRYEGYARLFIKLAYDSETRIPAKVIGWDAVMDLALLKTEVDAPYVFSLGSSEDLDVGDKIYAIGSPVGLERTLTSGIVSATNRKLFTTGSVMQIDAAVNSGNSGGPCIDENGNVQAIVFAGMLQYEGLNFAIPVEYLISELPGLFNGGEYKHSWFASYGHTIKRFGKDFGLSVQYVMPMGSADRAKIKSGDIITEVNGKRIFTLEDMQSVLIGSQSGSIVSVKYISDYEEEKSCAIFLAQRPKSPGYEIYKSDVIASSFVPIYGMKLQSVSSSSKRKYAIVDILKGSIADESGFSENDPVEIRSIKFNGDKSLIYAEIYAKNRKKGYLDISMGLTASLDSPYYF